MDSVDVYTKAITGNGSNTFSTIEELTALIDGGSFVDATHSGAIITVTASTAGVSGNSIAMSTTSSPMGLFLSSPTLTGGLDGQAEFTTFTVATGATSTGNITVMVGSVPYTVAVTNGQMPEAVAAAIASKLSQETVTGYTVSLLPLSAIIIFTSTAKQNVEDLTVSIN